MRKSIIISEQDNIAALLENDRVVEFFVNRGELLLGDIYTASVENILPGIDAAFVNLGKDKMGFLHANDVPGQGPLKERLVPKQKLLVQITKEPTGHKGPRVSTAISLPGRFLVLVPEERGVSISRRISEARERARLKSVVNLLKPPGVGLIIRTEAKGQGEQELFEDFELLWDRWQSIVSDGEASIGPTLIYRDQDLLYRVIRDAYSTDINEIVVDAADGQQRALEFLSGWAARNTQVILHDSAEPLLVARGIDHEIEAALSDRAELPSGGHLNIQPTEALTVIDVNSGRFTSSRTQAETVRRTNLEAAQEIPRQLRLRNIGGMVIVDFIDMDSRKDQQQVLEAFQRALEEDRAKPQVGQLSDLGLVELTRRRQGQSLRELFATHCPTCTGLGVVPTLELGSGDNKRIISTKPREEELLSKGRPQLRRNLRPQTGPLRAASLSGGRIQSTVIEAESPSSELEEGLTEVPIEILEMMPDDLLEQQSPRGHFASSNLTDDETKGGLEDEELEEPFATSNVSKQIALFQEEYDEDEETATEDELRKAISEVEQLRQELEQGTSELAPLGQQDNTEGLIEPYCEPPEPYSPFEAEPEDIAGVFRLKPKADQNPQSSVESHHHFSSAPQEGNEEFFEQQEATSHDETHNNQSTDTDINNLGLSSDDNFYKQEENDQSTAKASWWVTSATQQLGLPFATSSLEQECDTESDAATTHNLQTNSANRSGFEPMHEFTNREEE